MKAMRANADVRPMVFKGGDVDEMEFDRREEFEKTVWYIEY